MRLPEGFSNWKKIIAIAVIVVPWFFKDQLAASMDKKAALADQVVSEKNQQLEVQDQARDQREVLTRLRSIQGQLDGVEAKAEGTDAATIEAAQDQAYIDVMSSYFEDEGKALAKSGETFEALVNRIDPDSATKKEFEDIADQASATADQLRAFDANPDEKQIDALSAALNDAHTKLADGFDKLDDAANEERDSSQSLAGVFRGIAWLCTALGALLMGDWRKLLGGSGDEEGTREAKPESRATASV